MMDVMADLNSILAARMDTGLTFDRISSEAYISFDARRLFQIL